MTKISISIASIFLTIFTLNSCKTTKQNTTADACPNPEVGFKEQVAPLIIKYCISCHGPVLNKAAFAEYSVIKTMTDNGELYREVVRTKRMPKDVSMSKEEIDKIACWIKQGGKNN